MLGSPLMKPMRLWPARMQVVGRRMAACRLARHDGRQAAVADVTIQEHGRNRRHRLGDMDEPGVDRRVDQIRQAVARQVARAPRFPYRRRRASPSRRRYSRAPTPSRARRRSRSTSRDRSKTRRRRRRSTRRASAGVAAAARPIAELGRGLRDALARLGGKARAVGAIEDQRHRRLRHPRFVGDVDHGRTTRPRTRSLRCVVRPPARPQASNLPHRFLPKSNVRILLAHEHIDIKVEIMIEMLDAELSIDKYYQVDIFYSSLSPRGAGARPDSASTLRRSGLGNRRGMIASGQEETQ